MKTNKMTCPSCGTEINVDDLLVLQFKDSIQKDLEKEFKKRESELNKQRADFITQSENLAKQKENHEEIIRERVRILLEAKEKVQKDIIRKQLAEDNVKQLQLIKEQVEQESFLKIKEKEKIIADLTVKINEAKLKAEQGSVQLQGEVQELEILKMLQDFHPLDDIKQSKKGANAADILQIIRTENGSECGKIYYESKRTKSWSNDWIPKFKQDNLKTKADVLVLVTSALPKEIKRYGIIDGVWVCGFNDVKELSLVLRYGLLKVQAVLIKQHGKESKMELLYNYLSSEEFKNTLESIVDGFKTIQETHEAEKVNMQRLWKKREHVMEQVLANTINFSSKVKVISGADTSSVETLDIRQAG